MYYYKILEEILMRKLLLIGAGIILAASATLFAIERMDAPANGTMKLGAGTSIEIHRRR